MTKYKSLFIDQLGTVEDVTGDIYFLSVSGEPVVSDTSTSEKPGSFHVIAKFSNNQRDTTPITQEILESEVVIDEDLLTFGICDFTMPITDGIEEDTRVDIYEVTNTDNRIFSGFVFKIEPIWNSFGLMKIQCRSEKAILQKRYTINSVRMFQVKKVSGLPVYPTAANVGDQYWLGSGPIFSCAGLVVPDGGGAYYQRNIVGISNRSYIIDTLTNNIWRYNGVSSSIVGTGAGLDVKILLEDLLGDLDILGDNRTVETDFNYELYMDIKQGDNLSNLIDELALQCDAYRDVEDGKVSFKRLLGKDYSTGAEFQEIIYNFLYPNNSNIKQVSVVGTATQSNVAMVRDRRGNITLDTSQYDGFLKGILMYEIRDGNDTEKLQALLAKANKKQRSYQVSVEQNTIDAKVGDKIKLIVENTNSFFDIDTDVTITKKKTTFTNASKFTDYTVSEFATTPVNIESLLYGIKKDIQLLKM